MTISETLNISISPAKLEKIISDPEASAKAVKLFYVKADTVGYTRKKSSKGFSYFLDDKKVTDKKVIERINSLVIPPAWTDVWICTLDNGHLQATGIDALNRKQYLYHSLWTQLRNHTKFYRLKSFGETLPEIRKRLNKDLSLSGLPKQKVLALVVSLMEKTSIRIGNGVYEKLYGSFGLSTLKDKHADIKSSSVKFSFKGKKGVEHSINLKSKKLAKLVQQCKDIPGKELFQYYDEDGKRHSIDSGMVNEYVKELSGQEFTCKDFRTWSGTVQALLAFNEVGGFETETEAKKNTVAVLDIVSQHLGNTRTVCKKYYVHPAIVDMYENKKLESWFSKIDKCTNTNEPGLCTEEEVLMKILDSLN